MGEESGTPFRFEARLKTDSDSLDVFPYIADMQEAAEIYICRYVFFSFYYKLLTRVYNNYVTLYDMWQQLFSAAQFTFYFFININMCHICHTVCHIWLPYDTFMADIIP